MCISGLCSSVGSCTVTGRTWKRSFDKLCDFTDNSAECMNDFYCEEMFCKVVVKYWKFEVNCEDYFDVIRWVKAQEFLITSYRFRRCKILSDVFFFIQ